MEGGSFVGDFEGKEQKKSFGTGVSLCRGQLGNLGSPVIGNFRDSWKASERVHLFLWEHC